MRAVQRIAIVSASLLAAACGGTGAGPTSAPTAAAPSTVPVSTAPAELTENEGHVPAPVAAGAYVTTEGGFYQGLGLTLPDGWVVRQNNFAELKLSPAGKDDDILLFFTTVVAVVPNNQQGTVGQPIPSMGHTTADFVTFLTTTKDFDVFEAPTEVTIGTSKATRLSLGVSATANFANPDCPDNPHCAAIAKSSTWPPDDFFAIGGDEVVTIYMIETAGSTLWIVLDALTKTELTALEGAAKPIIDSVKLP